MANDLSITQNLRQLTLTLPADAVTVDLDVKTLRGQYTFSLNNNYTDFSFNPWSEDHEPSESFQKIVRETQIDPNSYYLETVMNQSLYSNFALMNYRPKVTTVEQNVPSSSPPATNRQSPCSSNWSDYLMRVDSETDSDKDDENHNQNQKQTDHPKNTKNNNKDDTAQTTTPTGTRVPQKPSAHSDTTLRLPHSSPKALLVQKEKEKETGKRPSTEVTPIVVHDNSNPSWEHLPSPSPPKTRPYASWGKTKPKRQTQTDQEQK